jgi:hypothetical protein
LPSSSLSVVCSLILFPLFATGVVDTSGNLPPVSTTQGELVAKFAAGVVNTGGKFAAGVVDTGGNLPPVSVTPVTNLPPVLLTPVMHLDLRPKIFEKIRILILNSILMLLSGAWGKMIHEKNLKQKIS